MMTTYFAICLSLDVLSGSKDSMDAFMSCNSFSVHEYVSDV